MTVNSANCRAVVAAAKLASKRHNQNFWFGSTGGKVPISELKEGNCGTTACLAGFAALLFAPDETEVAGRTLYYQDGASESIPDFAARTLRLNDEQVDMIFYNTDNQSAINRLSYLAEHPYASNFQLGQVV